MDCRYKEKCRNYCGRCDENTCYLALKEINKELQKENAELKSRLEKSVELPCKVGDTVYFGVKGYDPWYTYQNFIQKQEITMIILRDDFIQFQTASKTYCLEDFGKTVFLTKEEAEQALKGGADNDFAMRKL